MGELLDSSLTRCNPPVPNFWPSGPTHSGAARRLVEIILVMVAPPKSPRAPRRQSARLLPGGVVPSSSEAPLNLPLALAFPNGTLKGVWDTPGRALSGFVWLCLAWSAGSAGSAAALPSAVTSLTQSEISRRGWGDCGCFRCYAVLQEQNIAPSIPVVLQLRDVEELVEQRNPDAFPSLALERPTWETGKIYWKDAQRGACLWRGAVGNFGN